MKLISAICLFCTSLHVSGQSFLETPSNDQFSPATNTLNLISDLESNFDPKCHATATRLEYLVYGTPMSDEARYEKTEFQKAFIQKVWQAVANQHPYLNQLSSKEFSNTKISGVEIAHNQESETWKLSFDDKDVIVLDRDLKHYGSVAYSLRAILAVQQDQLLGDSLPLAQLDDTAVDFLRNQTDLITLSLLQMADVEARASNQYEIGLDIITSTWNQLLPKNTDETQTQVVAQSRSKTGLLKEIIDRKLKAYDAYNQINSQLFQRNLQVYFALAKLPSDTDERTEFTKYLTEAMISFAGTLYLQAQNAAGNSSVISEQQVQMVIDQLIPHNVNTYEDVIFYPKYASDDQVVIESYDMDAFRDSGLHWRYLSSALDDLGEQYSKEADPFAAELITEAIAHYGVLLLRTAGQVARKQQADTEATLAYDHLVIAYEEINSDVVAHASHTSDQPIYPKLASAGGSETNTSGQQYFTNMNEAWGVNVEHRTSDWLSRTLRSYLQGDDETTGNITIPPAFGGSGVAAEDIDGDNRPDLLILSGLGNKLLKGTADGFQDITEASGINWLRSEDNLSGEPRQPIIADIDNDGDQDIIITYVNDPHRVYRNEGKNEDGVVTFSDLTDVANLGGEGLVGGPATVVDINNDGLLDIYLVYFGNYLKGDLPTLKRRNDNGIANQLFINKGDFKFEQAPGALGADNTGWGQAVTHTDLNQDGWQDLIVGNDFGINSYYFNHQGKNFSDEAEQLGTDKPSYTMNLSVADLNKDGFADVYVSNIVTMNKDENYVLPNEDTTIKFDPDNISNMRVVDANDLFMSGKQGNQLKYARSEDIGRGHTSTGWAWGAEFLDVDNDGDDDLYVTNGMNDYFVYSRRNPYHETEGVTGDLLFPDASKASNVFFLNNGGKLLNQSVPSGLDITANSRAIAYFDFESDGDLDVVLNNYHDEAKVYRNNAEQLENNWLQIKLIGDPDQAVNLDAIGAQILVGFGEEGYAWRQVSGSQAYMSVHPKVQHVGIGKSETARIMVIWPNGKRQPFGPLAANGRYVLPYQVDQLIE